MISINSIEISFRGLGLSFTHFKFLSCCWVHGGVSGVRRVHFWLDHCVSVFGLVYCKRQGWGVVGVGEGVAAEGVEFQGWSNGDVWFCRWMEPLLIFILSKERYAGVPWCLSLKFISKILMKWTDMSGEVFIKKDVMGVLCLCLWQDHLSFLEELHLMSWSCKACPVSLGWSGAPAPPADW